MSTAGMGARYFFLSYPRLPPLPPVPGVDVADLPDEWVRAFYQDLTAAIAAQTGTAPLRPGFLDLGTLPADDRMAALVEALSSAEAFVPLLSPEYLRRSWPGREWASFEQRAERASAADPLERFVAVLWAPLAAGEQPTGLAAALSLAPGAAALPYAENGLRALLRLTRYRGIYLQIIGEIAARVVALAEGSPLGPSAAPHPEHAGNELGKEAKGPVFAVVGPVTGAAGHWQTWLAQYAGLVAEQLGFLVLRPEFEKSGELLRRMPGVVLIAPRDVAGPAARDELRARVSELPSWVLPVIIDDQQGAKESAEVRILIEEAYKAVRHRPDAVRRGLQGVGSIREFVHLMPFLVSYAEREYLRHGPLHRSASRPAFRPRLVGGRGPVPRL
jgi:hypothetical protein